KVAAGQSFSFTGTFKNVSPGFISGGGTVSINSGSALFSNGSITANVSNSGQFNPGFSPGIATVTGNYTQNSGGALIAEIGGPNPGTGYDQLNLTGTATLNSGSILRVNTIGGFCPQGNYRIMNFGSRSGDFTTKTFNTPAGG